MRYTLQLSPSQQLTNTLSLSLFHQYSPSPESLQERVCVLPPLPNFCLQPLSHSSTQHRNIRRRPMPIPLASWCGRCARLLPLQYSRRHSPTCTKTDVDRQNTLHRRVQHRCGDKSDQGWVSPHHPDGNPTCHRLSHEGLLGCRSRRPSNFLGNHCPVGQTPQDPQVTLFFFSLVTSPSLSIHTYIHLFTIMRVVGWLSYLPSSSPSPNSLRSNSTELNTTLLSCCPCCLFPPMKIMKGTLYQMKNQKHWNQIRRVFPQFECNLFDEINC